MVVSFASKWLISLGMFLAMDAFAAVDQEEIGKGVKGFNNLLTIIKRA